MPDFVLHTCIRQKYLKQVEILENLVGYVRKSNVTPLRVFFKLYCKASCTLPRCVVTYILIRKKCFDAYFNEKYFPKHCFDLLRQPLSGASDDVIMWKCGSLVVSTLAFSARSHGFDPHGSRGKIPISEHAFLNIICRDYTKWVSHPLDWDINWRHPVHGVTPCLG